MKIIIPIWEFVKSGGMKVLCRLANAFYESGHEVVIVTYYNTDSPYYPVNCPIQYVGRNGEVRERCKIVHDPTISYLIENMYERYFALKNACNRLCKSGYTVAIANYNLTAFSVAHSRIINKYYYIQAYEAWGNPRKIDKIKDLIARKSYSLKLYPIVNSGLYVDYKEIHSKDIVPPGMDLLIYHSRFDDSYWDKSRPFIVGHIGRTEEWKGSTDVALAVKILQDAGVNIIYKVAFNPPEKDVCKYELVKPDGDENLAEYYRSVDVLVAPGHIQLGAIHYPVIEAMACGTPVITTGYYPATNDNSYIVGVKSPNEIAEAIKSIMSDYSLAMKKVENAKKEIKDFSWDNVSNKMLSIIEKNLK